MPWRPSQSDKYRRLTVTRRSRANTAARRRAVHRSVANPNSRGLRSSHDSSSSPRTPVSFGGRPDRDRVARPASPCSRHAVSHRQTDRSATPTTAATSAGVSPDSTSSTAMRRTARDGSAFRGVSIRTILENPKVY
jgi:hypothetical protein